MLKKRLLPLFLSLCIALSLISCGQPAITQKEYDQIVSERDAAQAEVSTLQGNIDELNKKVEKYEDRIEKLEEMIENYSKKEQVETQTKEQEKKQTSQKEEKPKSSKTTSSSSPSLGEQNALDKAKSYLSVTAFSYTGCNYSPPPAKIKSGVPVTAFLIAS